MSNYRKLVPPLIGLLYVVLKMFDVQIPFAEDQVVDLVVAAGIAFGVWGLKNEEK